ncbi:MAG TPA: hypothetical protein VIG49_11725, partial [Acetobacteraceae bacterium]
SGGYTGVAYAEYAALGGTRRTEAAGLGTAIMFGGSMVVPPVFGWSVAAWGSFHQSYLICAAFALVSGVLLLLPGRD